MTSNSPSGPRGRLVSTAEPPTDLSGQTMIPPQASAPREELNPIQLCVADFRRSKKLAAIPNDAIVELALGKPEYVYAYSEGFTSMAVHPRGKLPGSSEPMVPIRFYSHLDFQRLQRLDSRLAIDGEAEARQQLGTMAWFCESTNAIEVCLPFERAEQGLKIKFPASTAKRLFGVIWHEAAHAAGFGEFNAFRRQFQLEARMGLIPQPKGALEIMRLIIKLRYSETATTRAITEFEELATPEEIVAFYSEG